MGEDDVGMDNHAHAHAQPPRKGYGAEDKVRVEWGGMGGDCGWIVTDG